MKNTIIFVAGYLMLCASVPAQEQPRQLRGGGHLLDETAEQFYSEGYLGDVLRACQAKDWKSVSRLSKDADPSSKKGAKSICATQTVARQQATSGSRFEYKGIGDSETMRADTFTFDVNHLVEIEMVYSVPIADFQGFHPKSFDELFTGLQDAYGAPTKAYTETVLDSYGVKHDAHRALWMGKQNVISVIEQPGENGWTKIIAETLAEYNRAAQEPKAANPLQ
jgi:hypothetical protein